MKKGMEKRIFAMLKIEVQKDYFKNNPELSESVKEIIAKQADAARASLLKTKKAHKNWSSKLICEACSSKKIADNGNSKSDFSYDSVSHFLTTQCLNFKVPDSDKISDKVKSLQEGIETKNVACVCPLHDISKYNDCSDEEEYEEDPLKFLGSEVLTNFFPPNRSIESQTSFQDLPVPHFGILSRDKCVYSVFVVKSPTGHKSVEFPQPDDSDERIETDFDWQNSYRATVRQFRMGQYTFHSDSGEDHAVFIMKKIYNDEKDFKIQNADEMERAYFKLFDILSFPLPEYFVGVDRHTKQVVIEIKMWKLCCYSKGKNWPEAKYRALIRMANCVEMMLNAEPLKVFVNTAIDMPRDFEQLASFIKTLNLPPPQPVVIKLDFEWIGNSVYKCHIQVGSHFQKAYASDVNTAISDASKKMLSVLSEQNGNGGKGTNTLAKKFAAYIKKNKTK